MSKELIYPNFLIVGTAKAATTTIYNYLEQHPQIYLPYRKEPCFFTFANKQNIKFSTGRPVQFITDFDEYTSLFKKGSHHTIRGEASTPYLYFYEETISNIKKYIPDYQNIKILIALRNPVERAYSQYMMKVRDLVEDKSFENALVLEGKRMEENAHFDFFYKDRGLYYQQVKAYLDTFKDVKIIFFEEIKSDIEGVLNEITSFLDLSEQEYSAIHRQNISGISKYKFLTHFLKTKSWIKSLGGIFFPKKLKKRIHNYMMVKNVEKVDLLDKETKESLKEFYKEDLKKLEGLLGKNLSQWYT